MKNADPKVQKTNENCFNCHGQVIYEYINPITEIVNKRKMPSNQIINLSAYYKTVHSNLICAKCHSQKYKTFPHNGALRMLKLKGCLDCHGSDTESPISHYEEIKDEFQSSVHYKPNMEFTCWSCHEPHTDIIHVRSGIESVRNIVEEDNKVCLKCHDNMIEFKLMTNREEIDLKKTHDWLPNGGLHFKSVRCIECHTRQIDNPIINHKILPHEESVKICAECHSQNSLLVGSLYKYKVRENRLGKKGFINAVILNEAYVIGANRNKYLSALSMVIFFLVIFGVIFHIILRTIIKK